jgi:hypothetical protein
MASSHYLIIERQSADSFRVYQHGTALLESSIQYHYFNDLASENEGLIIFIRQLSMIRNFELTDTSR